MLTFAEALHTDGDYDRAITEYRRLLSYYPNSRHRPEVELLLLRCYLDATLYEEAAQFGERLLAVDSGTGTDEIGFYTGAAHLHSGGYAQARLYLGRLASGDGRFRDKAVMAEGLTYAYELNWQTANRTFASITDDSELSLKARYCARLCREGADLKYKNPVIAGVAAIVPGLGYWYDGYHQTALSALLINGLFIWGTYEAFRHDHPGLGTTLALFELGWYAGNIYGSISSATRRNEKMRRDLLIRFDIGFPL